MPYRKAILSEESAAMKAMMAEIEEQPDLDYADAVADDLYT